MPVKTFSPTLKWNNLQTLYTLINNKEYQNYQLLLTKKKEQQDIQTNLLKTIHSINKIQKNISLCNTECQTKCILGLHKRQLKKKSGHALLIKAHELTEIYQCLQVQLEQELKNKTNFETNLDKINNTIIQLKQISFHKVNRLRILKRQFKKLKEKHNFPIDPEITNLYPRHVFLP